ncbi:MAG: hypothetical protein A2051_13190 [Desulfovibrionales bacterium GWA2_65_9]|nr:MAG: hypothetical protein A2051_13190 [Desulfovibrionales bacterium GWA2_65_9]
MRNDEHLQTLPHGSIVAVYGSGGRAREFLEHLAAHRPDVLIYCFLDSFCGGHFMERPVLTLDSWPEAQGACDLIVVASMYHPEIQKALLTKSISNFFVFEDGRILDPPPAGARYVSNFKRPGCLWNRKHWDRLILGYDDEAVFKEAITQVLPFTMVSQEGLVALCDIVRYCEELGIEGAFVECGVGQGGSSALMALMNLRYGTARRELHLFDSFQGLPELVEGKDDVSLMRRLLEMPDLPGTGRLVPAGVMAADQRYARQAVLEVAKYDAGHTHFHAGWFQETVPPIAGSLGAIALLRLDGDLYESTAVCLEHLYPHVVPGGFVYIDDWCLAGCRQACLDFFATLDRRPYLHVLDQCGRFWRKPEGSGQV